MLLQAVPAHQRIQGPALEGCMEELEAPMMLRVRGGASGQSGSCRVGC